MGRWMDMAIDISVRAVKTVATTEFGRKEIDIKRHIRIEKVRMWAYLKCSKSYNVDSRRHGGGHASTDGRHFEQGHHALEDASSHRETAHSAARLQS